MNYLKTFALLALLTMLFVIIGSFIGGQNGMMMAFVIAMVMNFGAYWFSDKIILFMYKAKPASENELPEVYKITRELTMSVKMPMPKIYVLHEQAPNAFATGRSPKYAAVCVTSGILNILDHDELKGVLAHELSHIKNRDTLIMTIAATASGAIMMLVNMLRWTMMFGFNDRERKSPVSLIGLLVITILAPIAAMIIQLAISRTREYLADSSGAKICHNPYGLAKALGKLDNFSKRLPMNAHPQSAHMFIVNPLSAEGITRLFATHPPIKERIKRLQEMKF